MGITVTAAKKAYEIAGIKPPENLRIGYLQKKPANKKFYLYAKRWNLSPRDRCSNSSGFTLKSGVVYRITDDNNREPIKVQLISLIEAMRPLPKYGVPGRCAKYFTTVEAALVSAINIEQNSNFYDASSQKICRGISINVYEQMGETIDPSIDLQIYSGIDKVSELPKELDVSEGYDIDSVMSEWNPYLWIRTRKRQFYPTMNKVNINREISDPSN